MKGSVLLRIAAAAALLLAAAMLSATGTKETPKPQGPVTVTAMANVSDQIPPEDNLVLREIRKRTGIHFVPTMVPSSEYPAKLNVVIASGDLPDIISAGGYNVLQYAENGLTIPLDDLLQKFGQNILSNKKELLIGNAVYNGKIHMIPAGITYGSNLSVRKDWLANTGFTVPAGHGPLNLTVDEYYKVLKAFTENDPNKNGKKDTIGLGTAVANTKNFYHIFGAYGIAQGVPFYAGGKVQPYFMHPDFLKPIEFIRKLYAEGLMDPDFATIPGMSSFEKLWKGIYGVYDFQAAGTTNNWVGRYTEKPVPQFAFAVVSGPDGKHGWPQERITSGWCVTSKSRNPDAAVKLFDFLHTVEGDTLIFHGVEGTHYRINPDTRKVEYIAPYTDSAKHRNDGGYVYWRFAIREKGAQFLGFNEQTQFGYNTYRQNILNDAWISGTPEIDKQYGQLFTDLAKEILVTLITTKGDYAKEYEAYKAKYLASGGEKWIEQATAIYKKENPGK